MSDEDRQDVAHKLATRATNPLNQEQIGKVLGISREAVNRMLSRRRKRIEYLRDLCLKRGECGLVEMLCG